MSSKGIWSSNVPSMSLISISLSFIGLLSSAGAETSGAGVSAAETAGPCAGSAAGTWGTCTSSAGAFSAGAGGTVAASGWCLAANLASSSGNASDWVLTTCFCMSSPAGTSKSIEPRPMVLRLATSPASEGLKKLSEGSKVIKVGKSLSSLVTSWLNRGSPNTPPGTNWFTLLVWDMPSVTAVRILSRVPSSISLGNSN